MNPAAVILLKKTAALAHDERLRTLLLSVLTGVVIAVVLPMLIIVSIFNAEAGYSREIAKIVFDGGPIPNEVSEELAGYMEEMIEAFQIIDDLIDEMEDTETDEDTEESEESEDEGLDRIKIKSFFYILYFTKDLSEFDEDFYTDFIECFENTEDDAEIYEALEESLDYTFSDVEKEEIRSLYLYIKYGFSATDQITGIPGEAFDDETFARLMEEATKYIGFPYVWGGSSPSTSFDCSGYVCWVYTHSGVYDLPRTTAQNIYNRCVPVSKEELKPGDLVFFTGTYQTSNPVSHIGIYVGDNQMLHAGDPIGYASLGNSYWIKHFYSYGRLSGM